MFCYLFLQFSIMEVTIEVKKCSLRMIRPRKIHICNTTKNNLTQREGMSPPFSREASQEPNRRALPQSHKARSPTMPPKHRPSSLPRRAPEPQKLREQFLRQDRDQGLDGIRWHQYGRWQCRLEQRG